MKLLLTVMMVLSFSCGCSSTQIKTSNTTNVFKAAKDLEAAMAQIGVISAERESQQKVSAAKLDKIIAQLEEDLSDEERYGLKKAYLAERKTWATFEMGHCKSLLGELLEVATILRYLGEKEADVKRTALGVNDLSVVNVKSAADLLSGANALLKMLQAGELEKSDSSALENVSITVKMLTEQFKKHLDEDFDIQRKQATVAKILIDLYGVSMDLEHDLERLEWLAHFVDAEYQRHLSEVSRKKLAKRYVNLENLGKF